MEIAVVDIETTGLKPKDKIVEIGIVKLDIECGEIQSLFDHPVKEMNAQISDNAFCFTHSDLTRAEVLNAEPFESYRDELQAIFNKYPTTAFKVSFDINMFLQMRGFRFPTLLPCIMETAKGLVKLPPTQEMRKYHAEIPYKTPSQEEAYKYFFPDSAYNEAHRAGKDAKAVAEILYAMIQRGEYFPKNERSVKCKKDGTEMVVMSKVRRMLEGDEVDFDDMTEGQYGDYMAEQESSGIGDNWSVTEITYKCPKCGREITYQID